ncbi:hypothetical protein BKA56DRAFT_621842 [Ilyonectria sp. MPI-CAGE-AT-0026]|nr:hypothetical protein BKA56DRAFT_621842 [Ilyonectria sp. MPI-CAGE-AT-0026]
MSDWMSGSTGKDFFVMEVTLLMTDFCSSEVNMRFRELGQLTGAGGSSWSAVGIGGAGSCANWMRRSVFRQMRNIRHHTKSRRGCVNCKTKRVKCDEAKPTCSACARRTDECKYVSRVKQASDVETAGSSTATSYLTILERTSSEPIRDTHNVVPRCFDYSGNYMTQLRLMHHYGTVTVRTFAEPFKMYEWVLQGLQVDIPLLAFEHPFLLDTVLLVAIIHMASLNNHSIKTLDVAKYRNQAICAIRRELDNISEKKNMRAIRASSLLLATTSFAADRVTGYSGIWLTNFLALNVGSRTFMPPRGAGGPTEDDIHRLSVAVASRPFEYPQATSPITLDLKEALHMVQDDDDWVYRDDLNRAASGISCCLTR